MSHLSKLKKVVSQRFWEFGFPLVEANAIVPPEKDASTLFISAGMQPWKEMFAAAKGQRFGTLQQCVRLTDIEEVGDGSHLTSFQMLGNFSMGNDDYDTSIELWSAILTDLGLAKSDCVIHIHPNAPLRHFQGWLTRGYPVRKDKDCKWSDGNVGGFCCEVYYKGLEIGNLVNPMGHSTDVGFGWERMLQVLEGKDRVDQTELFNQLLPSPRLKDHFRTLELFADNNICPGNKGREYVCRRLIRRCMPHMRQAEQFLIPDRLKGWFEQEYGKREKVLRGARQALKRNSDKPDAWWWDTYGVLPDEMFILRNTPVGQPSHYEEETGSTGYGGSDPDNYCGGY